jgi:hypothetical protein
VTAFDLLDCFDGQTGPVGRSKRLSRRNKVNEMMRDAAPLCQGDLRGSDFNVPVNLDRVAIDDFAAQTDGQLNSQTALAGCSGTCYGDD